MTNPLINYDEFAVDKTFISKITKEEEFAITWNKEVKTYWRSDNYASY